MHSLSSPRYGLRIAEDVARQRGTMLNLAFIVSSYGTGHPPRDGSAPRNVLKKYVYVKIVGAQHLRLKRRDKRRNPSPFHNASTWTGVSATNRSLVYREESDYYIVTSYRGCIQKSPLTHSNLLNRRKIELVSWEFNYESGSCVLEITSIEKA